MKRAIGVALSAALVMGAAACSVGTLGPTASPVGTGPTASPVATGPTSSPSAQPTPPPTPTIGPTGDAGFPSSVLGLNVHTVAGINELAAQGKLDGRLAAVGGYWVQYALPCAYMPHQAVLAGFCYGGRFADTPQEAQNSGVQSAPAPIAVPETANGNMLWPAGGAMGKATMVVLIVHAADSRAAQCAPTDLAGCHSRLVIDSVAWVNGDAVALNPDTTAAAPALTLDDVIAAGVKPGEQLVTAYPLPATGLNDVDPRMIGEGDGIVWFLRVLTGAPDADAIGDGSVRLVSDASPAIVADEPLVVAGDYAPARVILDSTNWNGNGSYPGFSIIAGTKILAQGGLDSSTAPLALAAGDYTVRAFVATPQANPLAGPSCDLPLTVAAGDNVAYYADFGGSGDCSWKSGTLFP